MRFRELELSEVGGPSVQVGFHPRMTVLAGLPAPARRGLIEAIVTAAAGGRADRQLTTDDGPAVGWLLALAGGRPGEALVDELTRLDGRLVALDEHDDRVAYHRAAARLAALDTELAAIAELEPTAEDDKIVLDASEAIEALQDRQASGLDRADRCRRVAAWVDALLADDRTAEAEGPTEASSELVDLAERWARARQTVARLERELDAHRADELAPGLDRRVALLAPLDQDKLWDTHRRVAEAEARLAGALERRSHLEEDLPAELEAAIDSAHIDRVRAEEVVAARWRPGILGSSVPAAVGLVLALVDASIGGLLLILALAVAARLIVTPRIALARASTAERRELARAGADSYLGLHLRRLTDPTDPGASDEMVSITRDLDEAARERTAALIAWKELVGRLEPSEADGLEPEIRAHAVRFNTALRSETDLRLRADLDAAGHELAVRGERLAASARGLLERAAILDAEVDTVRSDLAVALVERGIDPGQAPAVVDEALTRQRAGASRRARQRAALRPRPEVEAERATVAAEVAERERPAWIGAPLPPPPPAGTGLLRRRRAEVIRQITAGLPTSVDPRTWPPDEVPIVLDEPLAGLDGDTLGERLDALLEHPAQVIYLTEDPAVVAWARPVARRDALALVVSDS